MKEEKEEILEYLFRKKGEANIEDIKKDFKFINLDDILNSLIDEKKIIIDNEKVLLTEKGFIEGEDIKQKHEFVEDFLKEIGVPEDFAHEKACEIEHHVKEVEYINLIQLSNVKEGEEVEVILIKGGKGFVQRLCDLGLTPKTKIRIIRKAPFGPIEISVRGYNLVLGRGVVSRIWVKRKSL